MNGKANAQRKQVRRPAKPSREIICSRKVDDVHTVNKQNFTFMLRGFKMRKLCIILLGIFAFTPVMAQQLADTISDKVHRVDEITVKARRLPARLSSVTPVQQFGQEEIRDLGLQNVADAVRRFAGTNVRDYGGIGGLKTVSVRNLGAAHTAVSYDGVAVSNTQAGQIDIGRFPMDNISTLSLAIGQTENMLQSARLYASAGVLNIETERPRFVDGKNFASQIQLRGGSFGYITPSVRHWQRIGSNTSLTLDGSFLYADGVYPFTLKNGKYITEELRKNSDVQSWQAEANLFHTFNDASEWSLKCYYFDSERGLPGSIVLYNNEATERLWDKNFFAQTRYKKIFSSKWALQVQAKYNYSWNKYEDRGMQYAGGVQTDINKQDEYYLSAVVSYSPIKAVTLALAQDGIVNNLHTNRDKSPEPKRYTSLTALNARYVWNRLQLSATLLATYITETVENGDTPDNRKRLSPTVSFTLQPFKSHQLFLRGMYKQTFRVPTFSDLYYLRAGNTALRPEKATEYTAGVTWSGNPFSFMDYITLTIDSYYNKVTDKIIAFPSTYVWKMQNYGEVDITGVDVTLATAFPLTTKLRLNVSGNYSLQKALDVTDVQSKNYKAQLPYTPRHNGNVSATLEMPWVNIGYTMTAVGKRYYLAQNIPENEIDGYKEHTATLWREFNIRNVQLRIQAEVVNFTDAQYDIIKFYPMPGRSWRLTGTFKF